MKVGTNLRVESIREVCETLDRKQLLRRAIRETQGALGDTEAQPTSLQDQIASEASRRGKRAELVRAAMLWPTDGLALLLKTGVGPPTPFSELTEGLRALAIKEISFAASSLPVVTDQPEDAVPTAAVFDNLVPTLRSQRAARQFIVASHDANIVVAGDMEHVIVLSGAGSAALEGSLFDRAIKNQAIDLLEGGRRAFRLRQKRYGS